MSDVTPEQAAPNFYRRCRLCGREIEVAFGPEMYSESERELRDHILRHNYDDIRSFVLGAHGIGAGSDPRYQRR